jgi:hypothetical protein
VQVAVGWQHLANGNAAGAASLLREGGARLGGRRLAGVDLDEFGRRAVAAAARVARGEIPIPPPFPLRGGT